MLNTLKKRKFTSMHRMHRILRKGETAIERTDVEIHRGGRVLSGQYVATGRAISLRWEVNEVLPPKS